MVILHMLSVLLPPAFGVTGTPSQKGTGPPLSVQHRLLQTAGNRPVGYMEYLHETDLATCILNDHMRAGVWIAAQAATNTMIRVSLAPDPKTQTIPSQLFLEKKLALPSSQAVKGIVQLRAETEPNSIPSLSGSVQLTRSSSLFGSISSAGSGWLGAHYDRTFHMDSIQESFPANILLPNTPEDAYKDDPFQTAAQVKPYEGLDTMSRNTINCKFGSWMPIQWGDPLHSLSSSSHLRDDYSSKCKSVHGYAAINMLGATAAVHGSVPVHGDHSFHAQQPQWPVLRSYFSANLNDVDRPPLQVTLERDNGNDTASISLCQVLAFDRWQLNPVEDRAPKVRNTVAWTARMESRGGVATETMTDHSLNLMTTTSSGPEDSGAHNPGSNARINRLSLGAAWQLNRGLAVKAVLQPQDQCLSAAVILKRWKQPRVACSLLGSYDYSGNGGRGLRFVGLGLELETGSIDANPDAYYYNHHPSQATIIVDDNGSVPQTRAALPSDLKTAVQ